MKSARYVLAILIIAIPTSAALAIPIALENATADHSQVNFSATAAITGGVSPTTVGTGVANGWAIDPDEGQDSTAVFQTVPNVGSGVLTRLTFTLYQEYDDLENLGHFLLSVTTDNRSTYADGLQNGGNVGVGTWTQLVPLTAVASGGQTLTIEPDNSILASGASSQTIYTITATTTLANITGIRLQALTDPSFVRNGPGNNPGNGNFVVQQITLDATVVPEPSSLALCGLGTLGLYAGTRGRRKV